jgi:3-deoxy-D-manno-octulosonate 8-phosphate phosphatase (KDO 8-P phosphatase)
MTKSYKEVMNDINAFIFDIDGVLTDGTVHIAEDGQLLRQMNIKDGYAMKVAIDKGYLICIISGGSNEGVRIRLQKLGIKDIYLAAPDKVVKFHEFCDAYQLQPEEILYMGDDIPDYLVMQKVGLPTCPQDAVQEIKAVSKYISHENGGKGAVRDVIEQVLKVQGKWMDDFDAKFF